MRIKSDLQSAARREIDSVFVKYGIGKEFSSGEHAF